MEAITNKYTFATSASKQDGVTVAAFTIPCEILENKMKYMRNTEHRAKMDDDPWEMRK